MFCSSRAIAAVLISSVMILVSFLPATGAAGPLSKMDATLRRAVTLASSPDDLAKTVPGVSFAQNEPRINVIMEVKNPQPEPEEFGAEVRVRTEDVWLVRMPLAELSHAATLPGVVRMEGDARVEPYLNLAVPEIGVSRVWNEVQFGGPKGEGVIAAMVDTGIDLDRTSFRNEDGSSRVLAVWNYTSECNPGLGSCGSGFGDSNGHGTKVMHAMAGNSRRGCGGANACPGAAPAADIVVVQFNFQTQLASDVVEGVQWIFSKAAQLGKPAVVNLSLGWLTGPRDGTSSLEKLMSNLSGPGRIIVSAAGNDALDMGHARLQLQNQTGEVTATVECQDTRSTSMHIIEGWYEGTVEVKVSNVGGDVDTGWLAFDEGDIVSNSVVGRVTVSHKESIAGGAKGFSITLEKGGASSLAEGDWKIGVRETAGGMTTVDLWIDQNRKLPCGSPLRFSASDADVAATVSPPCTADNVICVGSYNTRCNDSTCNYPSLFCTGCSLAFDEENCTDDFPEEVDDVSSFSSNGPTRDGGQKPLLTAPGQTIVTPDLGAGICSNGTSLSSPLVAGTVALMLQMSRNLTIDEVREILRSTAQKPGGAVGWDQAWGWGKLRAYEAIASLAGALGVNGGRAWGDGDDICFIATAAFGDVHAPQVDRLRDFRDRFLLNTSWGSEFVRLYYRWSPPVAAWLKDHPTCALVVRTLLMPLVGASEVLCHRTSVHLAGVVLLPLLLLCVVVRRRA